MREWVSINGRLMPAEQAQVSVFDSGFMQGVGLFETMRCYNGVVFRLDQHLARLVRSSAALGWTVKPDAEALRENVEQVVGATEAADARVRLTVTTGSLREADLQTPPALTVVASAAPGASYPAELYQRGVTVTICEIRQRADDPTCGHKTVSYFARLASLRRAHAVQAFESIWLTPENLLAEGAISNVFVVRDGAVLTPPLDTPVLPGITRGTVLALAARLRMPAEERALTIEDLLDADEVFLTNSLMEIMPVVRVERRAIGTEQVGDAVRTLYEAYGDLVQEECAYA